MYDASSSAGESPPHLRWVASLAGGRDALEPSQTSVTLNAFTHVIIHRIVMALFMIGIFVSGIRRDAHISLSRIVINDLAMFPDCLDDAGQTKERHVELPAPVDTGFTLIVQFRPCHVAGPT